MDFKRKHFEIVKKRVEEPRKFIQVISGPRQIGKTTLALQLCKEITIPYHFVSADSVISNQNVWIEQQFESVRIKMKSGNFSEYLLIIDEVQKISNWGEYIKAEWDKDTRLKNNIKLILLGSSRLLLQQGLTESLTGRFELTLMEHWSFSEMKNSFGFTIEEYIWFGGYPGSASLINDENRWKDYIRTSLIETTISKDILLLTRVDKPSLLKNLFELGCLYSGQILSFNKMLGQLHDAGNTTTLSHYLNLLNSAGLLFGIEKYFVSKVRQKGSSPKLQVYNNALISAYSDKSIKEIITIPEEWGRYVESVVGTHIINNTHLGYNVFYWRENNMEVDFILERNNKIIAVEVNSGRTGKPSGLTSFKNKFSPAKILLIGKDGVNIEEFLTINPIDLF